MSLREPWLSVVTDDLSPHPAWAVDQDGVAHLRGAKCVRCRAVAFPVPAICHRCGGADLAPAAISSQGRLYSWTTVHVSRSRPTPYTLGYIDLPEDLRVLALVQGDTGPLRPGAAMWLVAGGDDLTFAADDGGAG